MIKREKFEEKMLNVIVEILESYVYTLNALLFILKYEPNRFKALMQAERILDKFKKVGLSLPADLLTLIYQYIWR